MWRTILSAAILFGLSSLPVVVGLAVASEDEVCHAPQGTSAPGATPMSTTEAQKYGEQLGYVITKVRVDDGCYELKGNDRNGASIELTINPYSRNVLPERGANG